MSGSGFDFRPPPERREPKQFQPPPWEEKAFEDLRAKRPAAEEAASDVPEAEVGEAPAIKPEPPTRELQKPATENAAEGALDAAVVTEMLAGLAAEDPPPIKTLYGVSMAVALFLAGIGVVLLVWAMAAFVGSRNTGTFGVMAGAALALFGIGFVAGGFWLAYKALRRRGVL